MSSTPSSRQDVKERIRDATDIVELVGQYVKLRRVGSNWQGLCPFHHERNPSFNVNPQRQNFYCFSCHQGGDVFSFIQELEGLSFPETMVFLAKRAGIPEEEVRRPRSGEDRKDLFFRINEAAAEFYNRQLLEGEVSKEARDYLSRRDIDAETWKDFQLGFAPQAWRVLHEQLGRQHFPAEKVAELGLIRSKSSGPGYYDAFRGRVIFPLRSVAGRVLGFGARVLDDTQPKYINSSDSPIYTKRDILYGLDRAWREIRRSKLAVLVEGYFDVISLHRVGISIAVAVCGTAFTRQQARLLKRYTERVCVVTDGDSAGLRAAVKASGILLTEGLHPTVATMEPGEDPDSLVRKEGVERFSRRLKEAPGYFRFMRELVEARGDRPEERERAVRSILEVLSAFPEGDLRLGTQLEMLSEAFEVELSVLRRTLTDSRRKAPRRKKEAEAVEPREEEGPEARQEQQLLRLILDEGPGRDVVLQLLDPEDFADPRHARIFSVLRELGRTPEGRDLDALFPDPSTAKLVHGLTFMKAPAAEDEARSLALRQKLRQLLERNRDFQGRVQALELAGEDIPAELLEEWRHLGEGIGKLRSEIDQSLRQEGSRE